MQALPTKMPERNCTGGYSKGLNNQREEHLVNPSESNNFKTHFLSLIPVRKYNSELTGTLFSVGGTSNIEIKIACHRVIGYVCICEGISLRNAS